MFPAIRQNGLGRWLAMVLALFTLAAGLLLCLALGLNAPRGRLATRTGAADGEDAAVSAPSRSGQPAPAAASRREPARR